MLIPYHEVLYLFNYYTSTNLGITQLEEQHKCKKERFRYLCYNWKADTFWKLNSKFKTTLFKVK